MKISFSFSSLSDLSDISKGTKLLDLLLKHGLIVEKIGEFEPIREVFVAKDFLRIWKGRGIDGDFSSCCVLFKGKNEIKFSGMVTWDKNLHPNTKSFTGAQLLLNIPRNFSFDKLVQLGDDIFIWSEAVYGFITEESKNPTKDIARNIYSGLSGLMWINYFGPPYIIEPDFHIPNEHIIIGHGARIILSEKPNDEKLSDSNFIEKYKKKIGVEWFWHYPRQHNKRIPSFDRSAITKKEEIQ